MSIERILNSLDTWFPNHTWVLKPDGDKWKIFVDGIDTNFHYDCTVEQKLGKLHQGIDAELEVDQMLFDALVLKLKSLYN